MFEVVTYTDDVVVVHFGCNDLGMSSVLPMGVWQLVSLIRELNTHCPIAHADLPAVVMPIIERYGLVGVDHRSFIAPGAPDPIPFFNLPENDADRIADTMRKEFKR